jgi:REP element-mobilizing transposase RayT
MPPVLAYFLTWTTHGTWLHGDERGSVDRDHNNRHDAPLPPDLKRFDQASSRMTKGATFLTPEARALVESTIRDHCAVRRWNLLALNARSNHIHAVVQCPVDLAPETAMSQLKAWSTRRLREAGIVPPDTKIWTEHGSTRWIKSEQSLLAAVDYVTNHQG